MSILSNLPPKYKKRKTIGRGSGSGTGKTCGRGHKGAGSRSGYRKRYGKEGGQVPLFKKTPHRGFTRGRFIKDVFSINLGAIDAYFQDGDMVSLETLQAMQIAPRRSMGGLKVLGNGILDKKVTIEASYISQGAKQQLEEKKISYTIIEKKNI